MIAVFLAAFVVLLSLGTPIAVGLGGSAMIYLLFNPDIELTILPQTIFGGMTSFPLLAIPLFMLAGNLMNEGGLTEDLVRFARLVIGHIRGGLGHATVIACAIFAAISGSAVATAVAIGMIMIPAMKREGFDEDLGAAITATAACMGPIIPPSIPFILYGVIANVSIGALFLGGVIPGLILGFGLMVYTGHEARRRRYRVHRKASYREMLAGGWKALPALFMPVIIMGGILGGAFTPTEAAGVTCVYAALIGVFVYRRLKLKSIPRVLLASGLESAMIMLLLGLSEPFAWIVAADRIPQLMIDAISGLSTSPWVILLLVNIILLVIGIPIETAPAIVITAPILAPMAAQLGIDPIHMGIVVCFNLVLGLITPPVGGVLFAVCGVSGLSLEKLSAAVWKPFWIALAVLLLITYIPRLSTFLPGLFMPGIR
ncbi:MAG: TRAP transporter large permease [Pseudomonadota bacterium]|jgi:C4-dicarboxylate transporter DctM subunit|nr:TRAP transporter large permease [Pseudomonadota bacterium]NLX32167.1 TRAP transporter large permease [Deltaproteobacteria bacterium]HNU85341.1 TRAP transporter large permease [Syntrophales bacterium]HNZ34445.1 TRAP transporter large permease [Syntrophales bacterium]HOF72680.1 TRAP transporter large permease [Syntrophales bacterium]